MCRDTLCTRAGASFGRPPRPVRNFLGCREACGWTGQRVGVAGVLLGQRIHCDGSGHKDGLQVRINTRPCRPCILCGANLANCCTSTMVPCLLNDGKWVVVCFRVHGVSVFVVILLLLFVLSAACFLALMLFLVTTLAVRSKEARVLWSHENVRLANVVFVVLMF